jgi:hypothetical protein
MTDLADKFEERRTLIGEPGEKWKWHEKELRAFFELCIPKILATRSVWLFVDALDECGQENAVNIVNSFKSLLKRLPTPSHGFSQFRVCFSCRHYPILDLPGVYELSVENENRQDIAKYVQERLNVFSPDIASLLTASVTTRANGVFLWTSLVLNRVLDLEREGECLQRIEAEIDSTPPDLDALYQGLIQRMGSASLKLIQWVCLATRPLSIDELRWAMIIEPDHASSSLLELQTKIDYEPDDHRMERRIKTISCGLTELISSSNKIVVQFIHQSVKDFFVKDGLAALAGPSISTETVIGTAHLQCAKICIRYLAMEEVRTLIHNVSMKESNKAARDILPFLHYATTSWVDHVKEADARSVNQENLLPILEWPSKSLISSWVDLYTLVEPYHYDRSYKGMGLVHVLSLFNILGLLAAILQSKDSRITEVNDIDQNGQTPLILAAQRGHERVVRLLLDSGADIEARDQDDRTPLMWATQRGHETIARLHDCFLTEAQILKPETNMAKHRSYWLPGMDTKRLYDCFLIAA